MRWGRPESTGATHAQGNCLWRLLTRPAGTGVVAAVLRHAVARCTIERLMRALGIAGAVRGKKVITTLLDPAARAPDRVDSDFVARPRTAPGRRLHARWSARRVSSMSRTRIRQLLCNHEIPAHSHHLTFPPESGEGFSGTPNPLHALRIFRCVGAC